MYCVKTHISLMGHEFWRIINTPTINEALNSDELGSHIVSNDSVKKIKHQNGKKKKERRKDCQRNECFVEGPKPRIKAYTLYTYIYLKYKFMLLAPKSFVDMSEGRHTCTCLSFRVVYIKVFVYSTSLAVLI